MSYMGKVRPTIALTSDDIEDGAILNVDVNASAAIANSKMATDTTNATNLASGTVPTARLGSGTASSSTFLRGDQTYAAVDTSGIVANQDDIALLGFKVAANGSLARYNLVDQSIDAFEDASGVDASASTNEIRDSANYYTGKQGSPTGGTITTYTDSGTDYTVHSFLSSGDFVVSDSGDVDYLIVAGGGAGGGYAIGGGGGGGGVRTAAALGVTAQTYGIVVGAGGVFDNNPNGYGDGQDSSAFGVTGSGGGGGMSGPSGHNGRDGGSGGGASGYGGTSGSGNAGSYSPVEGYDAGPRNTSNYGGGGGGGAGEVGETPGPSISGNGGAGGDGIQNAYRTGSPVYYAGGGGGAGWVGVGGAAGQGGAKAGQTSGAGVIAADPNSGGGGGGGNDSTAPFESGTGGSGIVVIRFVTGALGTSEDMTLVSNAQTAESAPTTGDLVMTISNGTGTTTPNTDIKAYISRDGSAYSSAVTLVDQGDTGGHTILTANGVDLSGITSGTSMRWKIETLNQGAAKETRVQAVSLGWS